MLPRSKVGLSSADGRRPNAQRHSANSRAPGWTLFGRFQGGIIAVPSDFLINEQGVIAALHYGKHFGDTWTVNDVLAKV